MANEQALDDICTAIATVFTTELTGAGLKKAYPGLPPKGEKLTFPYAYVLWTMTDMEDPDYRDGGTAGTGRMSLGTSEDPRSHTLWGYLMLGERGDQQGGLPRLDALNKPWVDLIANAFRSNLTLLHTCSRAKLKKLRVSQDELLGTNHYGIKYVLQVVARPEVLTRA